MTAGNAFLNCHRLVGKTLLLILRTFTISLLCCKHAAEQGICKDYLQKVLGQEQRSYVTICKVFF